MENKKAKITIEHPNGETVVLESEQYFVFTEEKIDVGYSYNMESMTAKDPQVRAVMFYVTLFDTIERMKEEEFLVGAAKELYEDKGLREYLRRCKVTGD